MSRTHEWNLTSGTSGSEPHGWNRTVVSQERGDLPRVQCEVHSPHRNSSTSVLFGEALDNNRLWARARTCTREARQELHAISVR
jgi:hypothetical protein